MIDLVLNEDIHQRVIIEMLPRVERYPRIVTAEKKHLGPMIEWIDQLYLDEFC